MSHIEAVANPVSEIKSQAPKATFINVTDLKEKRQLWAEVRKTVSEARQWLQILGILPKTGSPKKLRRAA